MTVVEWSIKQHEEMVSSENRDEIRLDSYSENDELEEVLPDALNT